MLNTDTLWVPFSVLNCRTHSAITRLVWLLLGDREAEPRLCQVSGLDAKTIAAARARLIQAPLDACRHKPRPACAAMPWPLLTNQDLSPGARLLYGQLQCVPGFEGDEGSSTYAALSHLTGSSDDALRKATAELVAGEWLTIKQANRKRPLTFTLRDPVSVQVRARISHLRRKVKSAQHRGQTLLGEFLNHLIDVDDYQDNATAEFLLNPFTRELMELDRYYPTYGVAFEFNGAQHYEQTDLTTLEDTVKQIGRDAMKAFLCKEQGIELVIIQAEDLKLKILEQKIPRRLPRRCSEDQAPVLTALEELALEYRERSADERERRRS